MKRLWPATKLAIGPAIDNGFYYDLDSEETFSPEDLEKIEAEMRKICKEKLKLERFELPREEAIRFMASGTSQPSLNAVVAALQGNERDTGLDLDRLQHLTDYWEDVRKRYDIFEAGSSGPATDIYRYEIPGGQYTNLRPQVDSLDLGDRFQEVKENYRVVNQMLGDIVKVTPSSKMVGDLAIFMYFGSNQFAACNNFTIAKGRDLSYLDVQRYKQVCVLGARAAQNFFNYADPVGQTMQVNGLPFTVIGVYAEKDPDSSWSMDNMIVFPYTTSRYLAADTSMPIIYLSPSTQDWNAYVTGSGSEEQNMNLLADAMLGGVGPTQHRHRPFAVEHTVAGGAVADALAQKFLFAGKFLSPRHTGGQHQRPGLLHVRAHADVPAVRRKHGTEYLSGQKFHAGRLRVTAEGVQQFLTGHPRQSGIIVYFFGFPQGIFLRRIGDHQHGFVPRSQINCRRQTRRAAADDQYITGHIDRPPHPIVPQ